MPKDELEDELISSPVGRERVKLYQQGERSKWEAIVRLFA